MNENIILGMVQPYLVNQKITYNEFEKIFAMLSIKEQYKVIGVLESRGIDLVDKKSTEDINTSEIESEDSFEILYDDNLFLDENFEDESDYKSHQKEQEQQEILKVRKNVKMSNDILIRLIQEGNAQAKQDLCIENIGLVKNRVNVYLKMAGNKLEYEDLEQAGMVGMLKAAERFDFSKGTSFSTYATYWINQSIVREIDDNGFTIRIPVHKMEQIYKVCRLDSQYTHITDYYERINAIADSSGIQNEVVEDCLRLYYEFLRPASLDMPVGEEEDTAIMDLLPKEGQLLPEDYVVLKMCRQDIEYAISTLKDREQEIIRLRFGLDDGRPRTLEEVGKIYNVTRERIRQIEAKALRKLRHPSRGRGLKEYWEGL